MNTLTHPIRLRYQQQLHLTLTGTSVNFTHHHHILIFFPKPESWVPPPQTEVNYFIPKQLLWYARFPLSLQSNLQWRFYSLFIYSTKSRWKILYAGLNHLKAFQNAFYTTQALYTQAWISSPVPCWSTKSKAVSTKQLFSVEKHSYKVSGIWQLKEERTYN